MRIGSLFSGIGGLELGLERAGLGHVVWQVESNPWKRIVLAKHWPDVARYDDIRDFSPPGVIDVLCGGFPCRGISSANVVNRNGLEHEESGLWLHFNRVIGESRPIWIVVENSPEWRTWMPAVRVDLARHGYASLPLVLSAGFLGAPHPRPRGFVVAYPNGQSKSLRAVDAEMARLCSLPETVRDWGQAPPGGFRLDDGVPGGMGQCAAYGDAVVPQVAEVIGRAIKAVVS